MEGKIDCGVPDKGIHVACQDGELQARFRYSMKSEFQHSCSFSCSAQGRLLASMRAVEN